MVNEKRNIMVNKSPYVWPALVGLLMCFNSASSQNTNVSSYYDPVKKSYVITYEDDEDGTPKEGYVYPGDLAEPTIDSEITIKNGNYYYKYGFTNASTAERNLYNITLRAKAPATSNLFRLNSNGWLSAFSDDNIRWSKTTGSIIGLAPGQATGIVFGFESVGLPAIIDASGVSYSTTVFPEESHGALGTQARALARQIMGDHAETPLRTIGPAEIPSPFDKVSFLDTINNDYRTEATTLGWIQTSAISNAIKAELDAARLHLVSGSDEAAMQKLEKVLSRVQQEWNLGNLTPEGYGLLKYNIEYLIWRLQGW